MILLSQLVGGKGGGGGVAIPFHALISRNFTHHEWPQRNLPHHKFYKQRKDVYAFAQHKFTWICYFNK